MNPHNVTLTFLTYWRIKDFPHIKITKDKKLINEKTNTLMKYNERGFKIGNKHYKRHEINAICEPIPKKEYTPF